MIACLDVPAERGIVRSPDDAALGGRQRVMLSAISFTVAAEDIRHFPPRAGHRRVEKYCGLAGDGKVAAGRGKNSKGLDGAQT
ncbi:hypothetical protein Q1M64_04785 (plasmid) [Sinorhizobium meliloti]|nr:hypothetical protein LZK74_02355 [Sinorhizobium meliloti]WKL24458.1 hypothetical protein Q1M63_02675 [Sinorhizobium meliloti]WKL34031.1 hypothetical protein Q1M62_02340 [Sinorhizobium meliloti]WKL38988.1 hypothetical protein Q1M64_04785 [Sinorhizobium meliloti]